MKSLIKAILMTSTLAASQAGAVLYKNPVTELSAGKNTFSFNLVKMSRDLSSEGLGDYEADQTLIAGGVTFGINGKSSIEVRLGIDDVSIEGGDGGSDGVLLGVVYRNNLQLINKEDIKSGFFASLQASSISDDFSDTDYYVYEFGAGLSKKLDAGMNLYGGAVLSFLEGTYYPGSQAYDFESADTLGLFVGIEKVLNNNMKIGIEANIVHQTGLSFFVEVPFN